MFQYDNTDLYNRSCKLPFSKGCSQKKTPSRHQASSSKRCPAMTESAPVYMMARWTRSTQTNQQRILWSTSQQIHRSHHPRLPVRTSNNTNHKAGVPGPSILEVSRPQPRPPEPSKTPSPPHSPRKPCLQIPTPLSFHLSLLFPVLVVVG